MNSMSGLAARYPDRALAIGLDVTQLQQRIAAVERAQAHFGGIDVPVNNAGIDFLGAVEEQREEDYRAQFEVNFFGVVAMLRLVLPGMRRRQSGTIVNISPMDGIASLPVNGYYASSKFALQGVTESLWQEIEPIGLRAFLVEPDSSQTRGSTATISESAGMMSLRKAGSWSARRSTSQSMPRRYSTNRTTARARQS